MRRLAALLTALSLLAGCGNDAGPRAPGDPTEKEIRVAALTYLTATRSEVVSITVKDHHVGVYVRGNPAWTIDEFVTHLPLAAETARRMLELWPALNDVDICGDGPWLPREEYQEFAPAMRVQLFRDRMARVPARFETPADVIREGGVRRSIDYFLDERILRESQAYKDAARTSSRKPAPGG